MSTHSETCCYMCAVWMPSKGPWVQRKHLIISQICDPTYPLLHVRSENSNFKANRDITVVVSVSREDYSILLFLNIDMHDSVKLSFFFFYFFGLEACEILIPWPVIEPMPPPPVCRLNHWSTGEVPSQPSYFAPGGWMCESFLCRVYTTL